MAKRGTKKKSQFELTAAGKRQFNKYVAEIRRGVGNVCEMHLHETNASISQTEFEKLYIDKLFATPIAAVSATLRSLAKAITDQKEAELQALTNGNKASAKDTEE